MQKETIVVNCCETCQIDLIGPRVRTRHYALGHRIVAIIPETQND